MKKPDPKAVTTMLDDLLATDAEPSGSLPAPLAPVDLGNFEPLPLGNFGAGDWAVVIGCLMTRLGLTELTLTEAETRGLNTQPGYVRVLACAINPETSDVQFKLQQTKASEFRS